MRERAPSRSMDGTVPKQSAWRQRRQGAGWYFLMSPLRDRQNSATIIGRIWGQYTHWLQGVGGGDVPLVFVHGVATRQTPEYRAQVYQRDALFKNLVLPHGAANPFDPDWGSNAAKFDARLSWIPQPQKAEAWAIG